jgi:hypothetical protein
MTVHRRLLAVGLLLTGALPTTLGGCGDGSQPTYRAGGRVTFPDGKPLAGGRVEFAPVQSNLGPAARGQIQPDGSFQLSTYRPNDGAVEGEHVALVVPPLPEGGLEGMKILPMPIDSRFTQFDTSGLKCTVSCDPAKNQFVLQVSRPHK